MPMYGVTDINNVETMVPLKVDSSGQLVISNPGSPSPPATGTSSSVAASATAVTLLAANGSRKGATIYNDSSAVLYVKLGSGASTTSFTALLVGNGGGAGGYFEVPAAYTGIITGIWASATGAARITELS
jgi:hypothetical protein